MWTHYKGKNGKKNKQKREREGGGKKGENKIKLETVEARSVEDISTRYSLGAKEDAISGAFSLYYREAVVL